MVGIIVYNNKGSTNLINLLVKIFVFLWDDSEFPLIFIIIKINYHCHPIEKLKS
jgi:uncharacterized membrane protein